MKLSVRGQNFRLQSATEEFATRKLEGLKKYLPNIREIRLELTRQENKRGEDEVIAQVTLTHERGAILRTEERAKGFNHEGIEAAINEAIDKMYTRIARFKGKREAMRTRSERFSMTLAEREAAEMLPIAEEPANDFEPIEIVKRKQVPVITMDEHEAIDQMELLGHTFFLYRDIGSGQVNVVYKRRDGAYGILSPTDG